MLSLRLNSAEGIGFAILEVLVLFVFFWGLGDWLVSFAEFFWRSLRR